MDFQEYIKMLKSLRQTDIEKYNQALEYYKTNYPKFYERLVSQLQHVEIKKPSFFKEYKWYLITIFTGIGIIIYLLYLLFSR